MKFYEALQLDDTKSLRDKWKERGVELDFYTRHDKETAILSRIFVKKEDRGKGLAKQAMKDVVNYADKNNLIILLSPTNEWGASKKKLIDFYKNFGFVENKGKNKNFKYMETMYRESK